MKTIFRFFLLLLFQCTWVCQAQSTFQLGGLAGNCDNVNNYLSATLFFSAVNGTFATFNVIRIAGEDKHKSNAGLGLVVGAGQMIYGAMNTNSPTKNAAGLAAVNIGVGLTTVATSIIRILMKHTVKEKKVACNLFCFPLENQYAIGFSITGRIDGRGVK